MPSDRRSAPLRAVIVDDETPARQLLREYLGDFPGIDLVGECANGFEAVKLLPELKPDLLFLDIQMPKLTGFEVLELIEPPPAVIFATAYDQFALKAFEIHAVDYLLKPFSKERLAEAVDRARERLHHHRKLPVASLATEARGTGTPLERVLIKEGSRVHVIPVDRIDYIEAEDDYVSIHADGKKHLKQQRLTELEGLLDSQRFVRVHRSFIINIDRIARIELYAKDSRVAILKDGRQLQISRSGYEKLKDRL